MREMLPFAPSIYRVGSCIPWLPGTPNRVFGVRRGGEGLIMTAYPCSIRVQGWDIGIWRTTSHGGGHAEGRQRGLELFGSCKSEARLTE